MSPIKFLMGFPAASCEVESLKLMGLPADSCEVESLKFKHDYHHSSKFHV